MFVGLFLLAAAVITLFNPSYVFADECNGVIITNADCPVVEQGAAISGNYRTVIGSIGLYNKETTDSFSLAIPTCAVGNPVIIRATALWAMREFDDINYWDESVDIARDANPAVTVNSDRRYKVDMGGGAGSSYIADITSESIVAAGTNTYTITNFDISPGATDPNTSQWGFGIQAIYECPEYTPVIIQQFEGQDTHWFGWGNAWDLDRSELICEQFTASISLRTVTLDTFMPGSIDPATRQADLWYKTGTGTMPARDDYDLLIDVNTPANGGIVLERLIIGGEAELATYSNTATIPVGDEYICFQVDSSFDFGEHPDDANVAGASMFTGLQWFTYDAPVIGVSLGDLVWEDANNNGLVDGAEAGICGVAVHLYTDTNSDGKYTLAAEGTTPDATTTTGCGGSIGQYTFTGLAAGDYIVVIPQNQFDAAAPLEGYVSSTGTNGSETGSYEPSPDPDNDINSDDNGYAIEGVGVVTCAVTLSTANEPINDGDADNNSNLSVDFGFFEQAKLGNFVWSDINSNGIQDVDEVGIDNTTATLYDASDDSVIATTTTDADGMYNFCYLIAGTYYIVFSDLPDGAVVTQIDTGPDDEDDSDIAAGTLQTRDYTLVPGQIETSVDAGVILGLAATGLDTSARIYAGVLLAGTAITIAKTKSGSIYRTRRGLSY